MGKRDRRSFESWLCDKKYSVQVQTCPAGSGADAGGAHPGLHIARAVTMSAKARFSIAVLGVAALLGLTGDLLLRPSPTGINVPVYLALIIGAAILLARWSERAMGRQTRGFLAVAGLFALTFAWRDSPVLRGLNGLAVLTALGLAMGSALSFRAASAYVIDYALALCSAIAGITAGVVRLIRDDAGWVHFRTESTLARAWAVLHGVLIALPVLLVFTLLFASADAAFSRLLERVFDLNWRDVVSHFLVTWLCAWIAAGLIKGLVAGSPEMPKAAPGMPKPTLGAIETGVFLGLVNLLFLTFVAVQIGYFFGGEERIRDVAELTYSEYARRGFFELCAVAVLVLPMLLASDWLLREASPSGKRWCHALAGVQLILLAVIMASAFQRMHLYVQAYGLTQLRLYSTAFMVWLAVVFGWLAATVLRSRRNRFAFGAAVAAAAALMLLTALNPDATIVRVNLARHGDGHEFDTRYALRLSADAVPVLVDVPPELGLLPRLAKRWGGATARDPRAWNWGKHRARLPANNSLEKVDGSE